MAINKKEKHDVYILGGLAGGGLLLFILLHGKTAPTGRAAVRGGSPPKPQTTTTANPQLATLEQSIIAAKTQAAQAYDSSVLGAETVQAGQNVAYNTNRTNQNIAYNTNAAQTAQARISAAAAQAIASTQATAQEQAAQDQLQAQQSQQQGSWWQSLLGFGSSLLPFLGSSARTTSPSSTSGFNPFSWIQNLFQGTTTPSLLSGNGPTDVPLFPFDYPTLDNVA